MHPLLQLIKNTPDIRSQLLESIQRESPCKVISFVNPFSYQLLRKNKRFFETIDHIYSDGMVSSFVFSKLLNEKIPRVSFDYGSFAKVFFNIAEQHKFPIFIVGSKEEQIKGAINQFVQSHPELNICGYHHGYFRDQEEVVKLIDASGAKYLICGLGTPKQDEFAQFVKRSLPHNIRLIYTCGGFLHQSVEKVDYYPEFVNKNNLRWLYRAFKEPKVTIRLITKYPLFGIYALMDRFMYISDKNP